MSPIDSVNLDSTTPRLVGAYYTPGAVAACLAQWAVRNESDVVLEPSMGDGVFLAAVRDEFARRAVHDPAVYGVEMAQDSYQRTVSRGLIDPRHAINADFLSVTPFLVNVVIGNPPYVRLRNVDAAAATKARTVTRQVMGQPMDPSGSMWMPFIAHSLQFLAPGGRLAFVLPYEATHVRYARPLWKLLSESFGSIRVLRSRQRIFSGLLQDVVVMLASELGSSTDTLTYELYEDERSLCAASPTRTVGIEIPRIVSGERPFVEALLSPPARALVSGPVPPWSIPISELATIRIGYVSGDKAFFHPDTQAPARSALSTESLKPAVSSGRQLRAAGLWTSGIQTAHSRPLFLPPAGPLAAGDALYIQEGERRGVNTRYKCRMRTPWYVTPDVRIPDFVLPVFSDRPQLVINDAHLVASNSLICGSLKSYSPIDMATSWYTSWTLLQVELGVHALGGGVLVLIPGELNRLRVASIPADPNGAHGRALDARLRANDVLGAYELGDARLRTVPTIRGTDVVDIRDAALDLAQWRTHTLSTVTSEAAA